VNKFLWNLFGIKEDDVPELSDPSRRGFLRMLGGVAAVGAVAPAYVFAPSGGWGQGLLAVPVSQSFMFMESTARGLNDWIVPMLTDDMFKPSPIFVHMVSHKDKSRLWTL
jgi:hypothetical protein